MATSKMLFSRSHILKVSGVSLLWFSYFTSLLYFSYIILFILHISFRTTCSRLAKTIVQLSIQILKTDCQKIKCKVNLCNISKFFLNDHKQELVKTDRKHHFWKICSNFIFFASFHRACVYLCLDFRTKKLSFWP